MAILSANTLFHFTSKKALLGILDSGFRASFCLEFADNEGFACPPIHIAMVCFCDIPVSMLDKHINGYKWLHEGVDREFSGYGRFGLGMSKEWGIAHGLNPVIYSNPKSISYDSALRTNNILGYEMDTMRRLIFRLRSVQHPDHALVNTIDELFFKFKQALYYSETSLCFTKPYQSIYDGRRYYDEREWRFVPMMYDEHQLRDLKTVRAITVPNGLPNEEEILDSYRSQFTGTTLMFASEDIKYLIVENDADIKDIIDALTQFEESQPGRYSKDEIHRLTTRILTYQQINEDF